MDDAAVAQPDRQCPPAVGLLAYPLHPGPVQHAANQLPHHRANPGLGDGDATGSATVGGAVDGVSTLGGAHYTASKAGLLGLTRAAAKELGPYGITVNAVCPGLIDTELTREHATPEQLAAYARGFPVQRLGTAAEVAELICFLASEHAGYITGAAIDINGGELSQLCPALFHEMGGVRVSGSFGRGPIIELFFAFPASDPVSISPGAD